MPRAMYTEVIPVWKCQAGLRLGGGSRPSQTWEWISALCSLSSGLARLGTGRRLEEGTAGREPWQPRHLGNALSHPPPLLYESLEHVCLFLIKRESCQNHMNCTSCLFNAAFLGKNVFQAYSEINCIRNSGNMQTSSNPSLPN